jgi:CubicO group peptidase (beta-lactamase class C family)
MRMLEEVLDSAVSSGVFPGCAAAVIQRGAEPRLVYAGHLTRDAGSRPVDQSTIYDAASLTKVLPTSTLALQCLERGLFALDTPVQHLLPELRCSHAQSVLMRHLLTHTLDWGGRLSALKDLQPRELLDRILTSELKAPPGERFFYSNATSILLGIAVERALGAPLAELAQWRLFGPLGLSQTWIGGVPPAEIDRTAPTERDPWRGREIRGEVHDETAWRLRPLVSAGSAGMFSTIGDLATFVQVLLDDFGDGRARMLQRATLDRARANQLVSTGQCTGLGWEANQPQWMGRAAGRLIGKTGFTGCALMLDLVRGRALAMLSNWTWPTRRPDRAAIDRVRADAADAVLG